LAPRSRWTIALPVPRRPPRDHLKNRRPVSNRHPARRRPNACTQQIVRSFFDVLNEANTGCIAKVPPTEFEIAKR
jgi:hypothetical protein